MNVYQVTWVSNRSGHDAVLVPAETSGQAIRTVMDSPIHEGRDDIKSISAVRYEYLTEREEEFGDIQRMDAQEDDDAEAGE